MGAPYIKGPVVLVFKNKNVDHVNEKKLPGVPENAVFLELAIGDHFVEKYKQKYNL